MPYEVIRTRSHLIGRVLEAGSLFVLLVVSGLRPLVGESYDLAGMAMTSALRGITDPLPLHTLLIDVAILAAACGWAVAKGMNPRRRYRWSGLEIGLVLVALAAVVSCFAAANQRVAINASVDWVSMVILAIALVQLLRERREIRLALCVIVASGAAQAYQCLDQAIAGFAETEQMYLEGREAFWEQQGVDPDSSQVAMFEARMKSREASGYLSHSNIAGAHLLVGFFATLGLAVGRRVRRADGWITLATAGLAVFVVAAMLTTHSLGALAAGVAGLTAWGGYHVFSRWIVVHRAAALAMVWALALGGTVAVVGHGTYHGSLPGQSLNFRWGYWTASAEMIADHPWTGVGRENFGDAYLKYKPISSPEEVKNPHNLLITAAAEWGLLGVVGMLALAVGGSIALTRPLPIPPQGAGEAKTAIPTGGHPRMWMLALAICVFWGRLGMLGSDDRHYLYFATVVPAVVWLIAFTICAVGPDPWECAGREGWTRMSIVLICGVAAFVLQDVINFALVVSGAATPFFALVAVSIAARQAHPPRHEIPPGVASGPGRWLFAVVIGVILAVVIGFVVVPVWRATDLVTAARITRSAPAAGPFKACSADAAYLAAMSADPLDPTAAAERAEWLGGFVQDEAALLEATASIDEAIARAPACLSYHQRRARTSLTLANLTGDPAARARAIESAKRALELYPLWPGGLAQLATVQAQVGRDERRPELVREAAEHYREALELDDQRPEWEEIRRFSPKQVAGIEQQIAAAQRWLAQHAPPPTHD